MNRFRKPLTIVVLVEVLAIAVLYGARSQRPRPPQVNHARLDPATSDDLRKLHSTAIDGDGRAWRELAEAYLGTGYYIAAEQCFHQASLLDPSDLRSRYGRGFCHERVGRTQTAIELLADVAQQADQELATTCWYQIGRCYLREEDAENAEAAFRKIPEFAPGMYQLAKLLIRTGRSREAAGLLDAQLSLNPNSLKLLQLRRHAAHELNEVALFEELSDQEERAQYQLILEYNQSYISMFAGRYGLARMLATAMRMKTEGSVRDRQAALRKPVELIRQNKLWQYRSVLMAATHVELGLGNLEAAEELLNEIERHTQTGLDTMELHAMLQDARGDHAAAWKIRSRATMIRVEPDIIESLVNSPFDADVTERKRFEGLGLLRQGMDLWRGNMIDASRPYLEQARAILPDSEAALFYLGETYRLLGLHDQAITVFGDLLTVNPNHGRARTRVARLVAMSEGDSNELNTTDGPPKTSTTIDQ